MSRAVEVRVAGQSYRLVSSASTGEIERLAGVVNRKLQELAPRSRSGGGEGLLLVAMALAHEVEAARSERESLELRTRGLLARVLVRIDAALGEPDGGTGPGFT